MSRGAVLNLTKLNLDRADHLKLHILSTQVNKLSSRWKYVHTANFPPAQFSKFSCMLHDIATLTAEQDFSTIYDVVSDLESTVIALARKQAELKTQVVEYISASLETLEALCNELVSEALKQLEDDVCVQKITAETAIETASKTVAAQNLKRLYFLDENQQSHEALEIKIKDSDYQGLSFRSTKDLLQAVRFREPTAVIVLLNGDIDNSVVAINDHDQNYQELLLAVMEIASGRVPCIAIGQADDITSRLAAAEIGINSYYAASNTTPEKPKVANWSDRIRQAIKEKRLSLVFQPIVSLDMDGYERYEVLIRLHESDRVISAREFMGSINNSVLISYIDRWVIVTALKELQIANRINTGASMFFIKLTANSLSDSTFVPWLKKVMHDAKVIPSQCVFELPENALMETFSVSQDTIRRIRSLGAQVSISGFGLSQASLTLLDSFDVDFVKLHRCFTGEDANQRTQQLKALIRYASSHQVRTLAGFVESTESLQSVIQEGVGLVLGDFLQPPEALCKFDFMINL
ncbi:MAG: hypothetical protein COA99_03320 [Moraxellaceae bacterium]|nr:MAG: hypothetical protein COA99_03320 [Moraxellaceae bacterium]